MIWRRNTRLSSAPHHFSRGDVLRGCSGFGCDTEAAIAHTRQIRRQMKAIFGAAHDSVYPLICGFETDEDALLLHRSDGCILDWNSRRIEALPEPD